MSKKITLNKTEHTELTERKEEIWAQGYKEGKKHYNVFKIGFWILIAGIYIFLLINLLTHKS